MKRKIIIVVLMAFSFGMVLSSCMAIHGSHSGHSYFQDAHYTCSMHPEVYSIEPGKCTKCGMELVFVPANRDNSQHNSSHSGGCH